MAKLVLDPITSGYASVATINSNNDAVEAALENTLSRDGTGPNEMGASLDMNSHRILNLAAPTQANDAIRLVDFQEGLSVDELAIPAMTGNENKALATDGSVAAWRHVDELLGTKLGAAAD